MKIAINKCFGGFGLSKEAYEFLGKEWDGYGYDWNDRDKRSDPKLIECIEKLGDIANGDAAEIRVIEIPDNMKWEISDYDGVETLHEEHLSW